LGGLWEKGLMMRLRSVAFAFALVGFAAFAAPASAHVYSLGTLSDSDVFFDTSPFKPHSSAAAFTDDFTFSLVGSQFLVLASETDTVPNAGSAIKNGSLSLFSGTPGGAHSFIESAPITPGTLVAPNLTQSAGLAQVLLGPGSYYLEVTGIFHPASATAQLTYSGTTTVSAVPEPATWAMMLLGFAGLGFTFRKSLRMTFFA